MSIPKFLQYLEIEKKYSAHTLKSYGDDLDEFLQFILIENGRDQLEAATKLDIRNFISQLSTSAISERTINRKLSTLRSYYKYLLKIGEIQRSPAAGIKTLKQYPKVQVPFSEEEMMQLLNNEEIFPEGYVGIRDRLILELFYQTGMRRSELIQLKTEDVDFA